MRVTEHVALAQGVEHRAQFLAALSRGSTPLLGANDVAAGGSERRFPDGEVLERRLLSAPPPSKRGCYRLAALIPEFATGPTGNFVSPLLYGHPNSTAAVDPERRIQNDRPRVSRTAAGYVENPISEDSKSVTSQRTSKVIDAQFTHRIPLLVLARSAGRRAGAAFAMERRQQEAQRSWRFGNSNRGGLDGWRLRSRNGFVDTRLKRNRELWHKRPQARVPAGGVHTGENHLQDAFRFLTLRVPVSFKDANCGETTSQ
jgi:hypothetical protein